MYEKEAPRGISQNFQSTPTAYHIEMAQKMAQELSSLPSIEIRQAFEAIREVLRNTIRERIEMNERELDICKNVAAIID